MLGLNTGELVRRLLEPIEQIVTDIREVGVMGTIRKRLGLEAGGTTFEIISEPILTKEEAETPPKIEETKKVEEETEVSVPKVREMRGL